ncbi:MAG: hypothetical protein C6Y22_15670 [Hapalosiphonaceae cyanobacterium JJU2]|nr:MAG: hypothetical protein C6Y22_15670 [Hapalosiphonaceae cyanobacterium JJU2]
MFLQVTAAIAAVNFAQAFRHELAAQGIASRIGLDPGSVLVFDIEYLISKSSPFGVGFLIFVFTLFRNIYITS